MTVTVKIFNAKGELIVSYAKFIDGDFENTVKVELERWNQELGWVSVQPVMQNGSYHDTLHVIPSITLHVRIDLNV